MDPAHITCVANDFGYDAVFSRSIEALIHPKAINAFTLGPHARRSCLVFAKVLGPGTEVGVVGWNPSDYQALPW